MGEYTAEQVEDMVRELRASAMTDDEFQRVASVGKAYADSLRQQAENPVKTVSDDVRGLLAYVYGMGASHGHNCTVEGGYIAYTHNEWRDAYRETIDEAIDEDAETFAPLQHSTTSKQAAQNTQAGQGDVFAYAYVGKPRDDGYEPIDFVRAAGRWDGALKKMADSRGVTEIPLYTLPAEREKNTQAGQGEAVAWAWSCEGMKGWALGHVKPTPENTNEFHERNTIVRPLVFRDAERARVFSYEDQPGNVAASRMGGACRCAKHGGDSTDHGLSLLKELQARGFGIVPLDASEPDGINPAAPQPAQEGCE